jgi:Na+-translocating ferredoxin:NAD+ oxidoreductase RnfA subunit
MTIAVLCVFAVFALNLTAHLGVAGAGACAAANERTPIPYYNLGAFVLSVFLLWFISFYFLLPLCGDFLVFVLVVPLSVLCCLAFEALRKQVLPDMESGAPFFDPFTAYDGMVPLSLILTLLLADGVGQALALILGEGVGVLLLILILREIGRRAAIENVPKPARGNPVILVSMGLLSLIFGAAALVCFRILC